MAKGKSDPAFRTKLHVDDVQLLPLGQDRPDVSGADFGGARAAVQIRRPAALIANGPDDYPSQRGSTGSRAPL